MKMNCPKCGAQMEDGFYVIEDQLAYARWYGKEEEKSVMGGEPVFSGPYYDNSWIPALRCRNCNAFTLFLPELKPKHREVKGKFKI
jgi:hypothetical protein